MRTQRSRPVSLVCAAACAAALGSGCGGGGSGDSPRIGQNRAAIVGGGTSPESRDAVAFLVHRDPQGQWEFSCTATLVARNMVLTARHCLSNIDDANVACDAAGRQVAGGKLGADREVGGFALFVGPAMPKFGVSTPVALGKKIVHDGASTLCGHDLGFLVLDRDLPDALIAPMRLDAAPLPGESLLVVGYGLTANGAAPTTRLERRGVTVRFLGPNADPPVSPNDFVTGESFCEGDSGGPAFSTLTGAIVGVATRVGSTSQRATCVDTAGAPIFAFYTQLAPFAAVADKAFAASGYTPWLEGSSGPEGPFDDSGCASVPRPARWSWAAPLALAALTAVRRSRSRRRRGRSRSS